MKVDCDANSFYNKVIEELAKKKRKKKKKKGSIELIY